MANQSYSLVCHLLLLLALSNIIIPSISSVKSQEKPGRTDKNEDYGGASRDGKHILRKDYLRNYSSPPPRYGSRIYSVLSFGAAGDGVSDDSKIDGMLLAPSSTSAWPKYNLLQWLNFKWLHDFTIQGSGTLDGQGSQLRNTSQFHQSPKAKLETRPTVVRFYKSYNITVRNIRIVNSPQCHLKFDSSRGIKVKSLTISSSQDSPNTDGIHLQNTRDVEIKNSNIGCGDDCVSIQTGCSNIHIHNVNCNPGHGISLGGLGRSNSLACVSDVSVDNINVQNALSGVRIKTWQGGVGSVRNVTFSNVKVSNVEIPIVIDQYYCNKKSCKNKTDAVAISDITYKGISGTYSFQPMHLACSDSTPCSGLNLINVKLSPENNSQALQKPFCWKSYGEAYGLFDPSSVGCLQRNDRLSKTLTKSHNNTC
uniref:Polygalacturonase n=1 Tax=Ananas comosus var. bracteatus TaxID=296719 RepID=A0A6V7PVF9_ANACO|nr:unnamed protein product [Ananas comosus var. bracteatus]